jgi:hypothetical protein
MSRRLFFLLPAAGLLGAWFLAMALASGRAAPPNPETEMKLEQGLKKAQVDGKYQMLLAQIKVDKDVDTYQDFRDLGMRNMSEYAGYSGLPKGFWVYAQPYWYIWRDKTSVQRPKRQWGPEQATGEPDTNMAGDIITAWASQTPDEQDEWLSLEYAEPMIPTAVLVYETYNPGALYRVTAFRLDGEEVELWKGTDPTPTDAGKGVSEIPVKADFKTARIRIYIASKDVPGWNEIDAVGVRDKAKRLHWAVAADASSTYAPPFEQVAPARPVNVYEERIERLESEVRELRRMVEDLKKKMDKEKDK